MNYKSLLLFLFSTTVLIQAQTAPKASRTASTLPSPKAEETKALLACAQMVVDQLPLLKVPEARSLRFEGKVPPSVALCRGGEAAIQFRGTPWVDWSNYWGTGDTSSLPTGFVSKRLPATRGVAGALADLELQRVALIKFNLFDNSGTFPTFVNGMDGVGGPVVKVWPQMRLLPTH